VELGEYEDPRSAAHLTNVLIQRRNKIGRAFFSAVTPLDDFAVEDGRLRFEDLAVKYGFREPRNVAVEWYSYGPRGGRGARIATEGLEALRAMAGARPGTIVVAALRFADAPGPQSVDVYLRKAKESAWEVVGIWRRW
jgi:hypothetical protein